MKTWIYGLGWGSGASDTVALSIGHFGIGAFVVSAFELKSPTEDYASCWCRIGISLLLFLAALSWGIAIERRTNKPWTRSR